MSSQHAIGRSFVTLAAGMMALPLQAAEPHISGPVAAEIIRIVDGDTILVEAKPWPSQTITTYVRLRGIDAPEMKSRCEPARQAARRAHQALIALLEGSRSILLTDISGDKYYGRILADISLPDGREPAADLLAAGLVSAYHGGKKATVKCSLEPQLVKNASR